MLFIKESVATLRREMFQRVISQEQGTQKMQFVLVERETDMVLSLPASITSSDMPPAFYSKEKYYENNCYVRLATQEEIISGFRWHLVATSASQAGIMVGNTVIIQKHGLPVFRGVICDIKKMPAVTYVQVQSKHEIYWFDSRLIMETNGQWIIS